MSEHETLAQRAARLRERIHEDYPDAWDFREIPELIGVVEGLTTVNTERGERIVVTIREVEGPADAPPIRRAVWLSQKALYERFRALNPAVGELVAIRYLGVSEHAQPGQSPAHRFRVEADRPGERFVGWPTPVRSPALEQRTDAELDEAEHAAAMERYAPAPADDDIPF